MMVDFWVLMHDVQLELLKALNHGFWRGEDTCEGLDFNYLNTQLPIEIHQINGTRRCR